MKGSTHGIILPFARVDYGKNMKTYSFDHQHLDLHSNWTVTMITLVQWKKQCKTLNGVTKSIRSQ
jgi:hypothetical protein